MRRTAHEFWESVLEEIDDGGFFHAAPETVMHPGADQTRLPADPTDAALIHKRGLVVVASVYALLAMLASIGVVLVLVVA